jgi:outer membrane protein TolC
VELFREGILPQAELSFRASLAAYQAGRSEFIMLLDAERTLRESRMNYFKSQVALIQALADLERVVGKELQ